MHAFQKSAINYRSNPIINEVLTCKGKTNEIIEDGRYKVTLHIDTNYTLLTIDWPNGSLLPNYLRSNWKFNANYNEAFDHLMVAGTKPDGTPYEIFIQLPPKRL